jgi:hypothetical protein
MDIYSIHFHVLLIEMMLCLGLFLIEAEHLIFELYRLLNIIVYAMGWVVVRSSWLSDY